MNASRWAKALAGACEDGVPFVLARDVADQLLDQDGLAEAGAAEETNLAAAHERRDQVDHLHSRLEDLHGRLQRLERRRVAVDRPKDPRPPPPPPRRPP